MPVPAIPSARFRRIGIELRRLREEHGLSLRSAAASLERSPSSLSMIETGLQSIRPRDLEYILLKYGIADGAFREAMLELAREGRKTGWWRGHSGTLTPEVMDFVSLEADARTMRLHAPLFVPGLFQSSGYARSIIRPDPAGVADRAIEIRMARQAVLGESDPPAISAVFGEAVLRQEVGGPDVMRDQLGRLGELSERGHVEFKVIPYKAGWHRGLRGPFTLLEVGARGRLTVATIENLQGISYVERADEVRRYTEVFDELSAIALPESDSRSLMERIRSEL